jgi:hypothetical protein
VLRRAVVTSALLSAALQVRRQRKGLHSGTSIDARIQQMSAASLDAVHALEKKACELHNKAHFARAAEKIDAAVLAAEALGHDDCLITATLRVNAAMMWWSHATAHGVLDADRVAAMNHAASHLRLAQVVLERRKAAGTLQPYKCRPAEEAWFAARPRFAASKVPKCLVPFLGYDAFLLCASFEMQFFTLAHQSYQLKGVEQLVSFVVSAADMFLQPRENFRYVIPGEVAFFKELRDMHDATISSAAASRWLALLDAWRRLEGARRLLRERHVDLMMSNAAQISGAQLSADEKAIYAAAVLHTCALETCNAREVHESQFKKCGACRTVSYCCREHQVEDWPAHKAACKAARKAAAQNDAA